MVSQYVSNHRDHRAHTEAPADTYIATLFRRPLWALCPLWFKSLFVSFVPSWFVLENLTMPTTCVLEGIDEYRVTEPVFEAFRIVLTHYGAPYSPAYLQGLSGAAFRIAGICPCAPTVSTACKYEDFVTGLGYQIQTFSPFAAGTGHNSDNEFSDLMTTDDLPPLEKLSADAAPIHAAALVANAAIKAHLRAGHPAVVWHAFTTTENDVVCGYDDATGEWLGRGTYHGARGPYARATQYRWLRCMQVGGWPLAHLITPGTGQVDLPALERAALAEAVRHGRDPERFGHANIRVGLNAYNQWALDWQSPTKKRDGGDFYCYLIYCSTHAAAADFLREIAPRHPAARDALVTAADHFAAEAHALLAAEAFFRHGTPAGPFDDGNRAVARRLAAARDHYAAAIDHLERALPQLS